MNCEKQWDVLSLCIMPTSNLCFGSTHRSIASCAVKFPTEVARLNILELLYLSSSISLDLFTRPFPSTVIMNSPVEICWLQIIVVLDCIVTDVLLKSLLKS